MDKHPLRIWSVGGAPAPAFGATPAPADVESWGESWKSATYEYLIGVAARAWGTNSETVAAPAFIESQRRLRAAIDDFNTASTRQTTQLLAQSQEASRQTDTLIRLTYWIIGLTVVLGVIAAVQLWAMLKGCA